MACSIEIQQIIGAGSPLAKIVVIGTAEDCPDGVEGSNLEVTLSCRSADDPDARVVMADTHPAGSWLAEFLPPLPNCGCGGPVFVTARCLARDGCEAVPVATEIACDTCPQAPFSDDDVNPVTIEATCDFDGTVLVKIVFTFFNDTSLFLAARVNPGPGGSVVTQIPTFVTPGSTGGVQQALLRYDPAVTPIPAPFIEYVNFDGFTLLNCPPVTIDVPALPACEPSECPTTVVLEVTNSVGQVVQVSGNNAQLCLLPDEYTVSVVQPAPQSGDCTYDWSLDGSLVSPQPGAPQLDVSVGAGQTREVTVAVRKGDCPAPSAEAELIGCVIDCDLDLVLDLRDANGAAVALDQGCIPPGTYTAEAVGPVEPPWDFAWMLNGAPQITSTTDSFDFTLGPGETANVSVTASAPGCEAKTEAIGATGCTPPANGDNFGCGALLLGAIGLMLGGAATLIAGICFGSLPVVIVGAAGLVIGLLMLALWFYWCRKHTACATLQTARCLLFYAGLLFAVAAIVLSLSSGLACGIPAAVSAFGWAALSTLITDAMLIKGCTVKPCLP